VDTETDEAMIPIGNFTAFTTAALPYVPVREHRQQCVR
jgi:hypothetical protein